MHLRSAETFIPNFIHQQYIDQVIMQKPMIPHHSTHLKAKKTFATNVSCLINNGTRHSLRSLLYFKEVISKQLPNMPKYYISKVVFDGRHESILIEGDSKIIGGACFRCFEGKPFAELVFLAISHSYRDLGLGSKVIDSLKGNCGQT